MAGGSDDWNLYARDVKRIKPKAIKVAAAKPAPVSPQIRKSAEQHGGGIVFTAAREKPVSDWSAPLEKRAERDLRAGTALIDAKIDLHGMTQDEAYKSLARFIATHVKRGTRNLLVITGRGSVLKGGVLRSSLRDWLEALPETNRILSLRQAAPQHGGNGAYYVVLKKLRE